MNINSLAKGISVGMAVGAVTYALACATKHEKKMLKSNAGKAIKAIGNVFDDVSSMMK